jgi:pimeloyl-ACP methyl ester carboxylesterase
MAIEFPERVLSLTSMMSSTGEQEYGQSTPEAQQVLFSPRPADREGYIAGAERELVWASRRYGDPAQLRALAAASYDRSYYPAGVPRQLAAMILDGSRADALRALDVPTLVIHGVDDTLIDPTGGERTAGWCQERAWFSSRTWVTTARRLCGHTWSMRSASTSRGPDTGKDVSIRSDGPAHLA